MAYIALTRRNSTSTHQCTVCLDKNECNAIRPQIEKSLLQAKKKYERLKDIHDSGESSSRQQTAMCIVEERIESLESVLYSIDGLTKM